MVEHSASAPGRVNLIGEHTDHQGGLVLPLAIGARVRVALRPRGDDRVRASTAAALEAPSGGFTLGEERRTGGWIDFVAGITRGLRVRGLAISGFDCEVASTVPIGAGLASSAALEVALLRALSEAFALGLDALAIAHIAHWAETEHVGARVGLMDQLVVSLGEVGIPLFIDLGRMEWESIPLPAGLELLVIDSGLRHEHASGGYNLRREECEAAALALGVPTLTDGAGHDLGALPAVLARRVRHVISENARVRDAVAALRGGDHVSLGTLLTASHRSLRDDFEVSVPEIDVLVAVLDEDPDVLGARMIGGGFGGSVLALTRPGSAAGVGARALASYRARVGERGAVVLPA